VDTISVAWAPASPSLDDAEYLRTTSIAAYTVLRETDPQRQRQIIVTDLMRFLDASVVRAYDLSLDDDSPLSTGASCTDLPVVASAMEQELIWRALEYGDSLISNHPRLAPELSALALRCRDEQVVTHVLLARAHGRTQGVFAVHWIGRGLPSYVRREGFYNYWSSAGLALAATRERARVEREIGDLRARLLTDALTGLPNGVALDERLREYADMTPLSIVAVDFDGMREANNVFKTYALGGDVLIRVIGQALPALIGGEEFAARLHGAGDEFAIVLPHADEPLAMRRAQEIEAALDALDVPASHRPVYRGASVAAATRRSDETPSEVRDRAVAAMHDRKALRRQARCSTRASAGPGQFAR
jgi:diguanylate cyclase (GGDEF)-like protein